MSASLFPRDYRDSRAKFLEACRGAGARCESLEHPLRGSDGEPVATDLAWFGAREARRVLIVSCGTHGVEGLCGAGMQLGLLRSGLHRRLREAVRLVLVHAVNPHGFLDLRRTNEDNVDLNRNFLAHDGRYPDDAAYAQVHPLLVPDDWDGPARAAADAELARYIAERGPQALQAAVSGGQYSFPDGLFYGGRAPAWSNRTWRELVRRAGTGARQLAIVDLHSGLGRRGACELISGAQPGSREHRLARAWFGQDIVFPGSTSTAPAAAGYMGAVLPQIVPQADAALVVAEIGTVAFDEVLHALRADNWLHARGLSAATIEPVRGSTVRPAPGTTPGAMPDRATGSLHAPASGSVHRPIRRSSLWHEIKAAMQAAFVGRDAAWQEEVAAHGLQVCERAIAGLLDTPDAPIPEGGMQ